MRLAELLRSRPMSLLVSLPANSPDLARAAVEAGADALKVHINVHHRASGTHFGSFEQEREALATIRQIAGDRPVGLVAGGSADVPATEVAEAVRAGFDTISAYAHHLPASWLAIPGAHFMAAPDHSYTAGEISALAGLPVQLVEASVIHPDGYGQPLTVRDLMLYRSIASTLPQPVVVPSQRRLLPQDLAPLLETGVRAVMIGAVVAGRDSRSLYEATVAFRKAVDQL